jgi:hypothetical protein
MANLDTHTTHVDEVLTRIERIGTFDLNYNLYKDFLIHTIFRKNNIREENIPALLALTGSASKYKYKIAKKPKHIKIVPVDESHASNSSLTDLPNVVNKDNNFTLEEAGKIIREILEKEALIPSDDNYNYGENENYENFVQKIDNQKGRVIQYLSSTIKTEIEVKNICNEIIRSLLIAEYLIMPDYSEKLENTIKKLEIFYGSNASVWKDIDDNKSFYFIKSFVRIAWLIIDYCYRDRLMMKPNEDPKEILIINTDTRKRFYANKFFNTTEFTVGRSWTRLYERLMMSVVEMTAIDHHFVVSNENIEKLNALLGSLKNCGLNEELVRLVEIKTSVLLHEMLDKITKNDCHINIDMDIKHKCRSTYEMFENVETNHPYLSRRGKAKKQKNIINYNDEFLRYEYSLTNSDIQNYDNFFKEGIKNYCDNSLYFNKLYKKTLNYNDIETLINTRKPSINSQDLIIDLLEFLSEDVKKDIDNKKTDIDKKLHSLHDLIVMLDKYISIHKTNQVAPFRPTFLYSFYNMDAEGKVKFTRIEESAITAYDSEKIPNNTFFFSSALLTPFRMVWLERQLSEYKNKIQQLNFDYDHLLSNNAITTFEQLQAKFDKVDENLKSEFDASQKNHVTTLGIFAGMITFVTASVSYFRVNGNNGNDIPFENIITYYILFALVLVFGLGGFAIFLRNFFIKKEPPKKDWLFWGYMAFATLLLALCILIIYNKIPFLP